MTGSSLSSTGNVVLWYRKFSKRKQGKREKYEVKKINQSITKLSEGMHQSFCMELHISNDWYEDVGLFIMEREQRHS